MREREEHFYSNIIKLCLDIISTASVPPPNSPIFIGGNAFPGYSGCVTREANVLMYPR